MATFTIRLPDSMVGQLSSAEVRNWLSDFLRAPGELPDDPGSGDFRVSLTLPEQLVLSLAARLGCSPSTALRRLASWRLELWQDQATQTESADLGTLRSVDQRLPALDFGEGQRHDETPLPPINGTLVLIEVCIALIVIGWMIFSQSRDANS